MERIVATLKKLLWVVGICAWLGGAWVLATAHLTTSTDHDAVPIAQGGGVLLFVVGAFAFWFLATLYTYRPQGRS